MRHHTYQRHLSNKSNNTQTRARQYPNTPTHHTPHTPSSIMDGVCDTLRARVTCPDSVEADLHSAWTALDLCLTDVQDLIEFKLRHTAPIQDMDGLRDVARQAYAAKVAAVEIVFAARNRVPRGAVATVQQLTARAEALLQRLLRTQ